MASQIGRLCRIMPTPGTDAMRLRGLQLLRIPDHFIHSIQFLLFLFWNLRFSGFDVQSQMTL